MPRIFDNIERDLLPALRQTLEVSDLRRLADAEDLLTLRKAKRAEGKKKSIPLAEVKRELGIR